MKKYISLSLLLLVFVFTNSCKKDCKNTCRCDYGTIQFPLSDKNDTKNSYFDTHPELNTQNVMLYDEFGNYATENGKSWELKKQLLFLSNPLKFDYHNPKTEPFGIDKKKTFYLHLDKDIDTIRVEYKVKNECMDINYMRVFYNNQLVLKDNSPNLPIFGTDIINK
jgi:hypothetical protein